MKSKHDFGVGWDLDASAGEIQQKHPFHDGWLIATDDDPFSLPCGIVLDQEAHATEIRLSVSAQRTPCFAFAARA